MNARVHDESRSTQPFVLQSPQVRIRIVVMPAELPGQTLRIEPQPSMKAVERTTFLVSGRSWSSAIAICV